MNSLLESLTGRLGGARQAMIIAVGVVVTALVFGVSRWATKPTMVPLYADVPVEQVKAMTDKLTEAGITYELDRTGSTIMVQSADLARARVDLAAGTVPNSGRPGLELFDKPTWGMTDFTQKVNYRRALEGELERTISKMKDVKSVKVHLAIEDDQLFKQNERPSKASVTLAMNNSIAPRAEAVRGIASLVASSVGGLEPEHVTIVDERGEALTMEDDGSMAGLTSRQLSVQREAESYLEQKADKLLSSLVGSGNARVQVSASMNFDKVERTVQAVDPDRQAIATEQKAEVTPSNPQQGAGYSTTATSYENTRSVENFTGAVGNIKKLTVAVLVADRVVLPPAAPVPADSAAAAAAAALPPVAPTIETRTPDELTRIEALVRNALGVDSTRGDMISVVSAPFDMPAPVVAVKETNPVPTDLLGRIQSNPKPVVAIAALVVLLILALVTVVLLRPKKQQIEAPAVLPAAPAYAELPASTQMQQAMQEMLDEEPMDQMALIEEQRRQIVLPPPPTTPEREQAMATVDQRPDAALRVVRNWLRQ
ncbi:MAG TPA: flagellar M-ring protein FliF [Gemmatimonas aurantiaca]|uniref:Flagellar M-ring protein n=2 Tax=Gemmatimonas aurantiaca TaxID=173480 RepID=C1A563_GEMAT|nr:flagellar basal-body MS-ring/collar protein FliF [Gemmatimonas aurantiaca]BAH37373.1 flagellar M-ring protein [Gemmatimonas aurantiaca T-27]HCT55789.1 flagellar M-ring protein FliF [Gemmatimonas aurantiaca]